MAYCRLGSCSDVYVYASLNPRTRASCWVAHISANINSVYRGKTIYRESRPEMFHFLSDLKRTGVRVPESVFKRLYGEIKKAGESLERKPYMGFVG